MLKEIAKKLSMLNSNLDQQTRLRTLTANAVQLLSNKKSTSLAKLVDLFGTSGDTKVSNVVVEFLTQGNDAA